MTPPAEVYLQLNTDYWADDIIRPVVSVSLEIYLYWWSHRGYHPPSSQCFTGDIPLLVDILSDSTSRGISPVRY
jgi:hypothetical protein